MESRTALILGASGLVGGHLLALLAADSRYGRIVSLGRRELPRSEPKLKQHAIDFDRIEEHAGLFAVDDIFCCLGTTIRAAGSQEAFRRVDHDYPLRAARLGAEAGAGQFLIVTALGADAGSSIFYNRVKGELEMELRGIPYRGVQIFRPSLLLGNRAERRAGERIAAVAMRFLDVVMVGPLRRYRAIEAEDVARAMIVVAQRAPAGFNVYESERIREIATQG